LSAKIRTAERTADILCCFLKGGPELRVADIVARLDLDKGTLSRLLSTLASRGLVVKDPLTRRYRLGPVIVALGNAANTQQNLAQLALPSLTRLRDISSESAGLDVLMGDARVCVAQVESRQDLRRVIEVGSPIPPHAGAAGKVLLAYLPDQALADMLKRIDLVRMTPYTITNRSTLLAELKRIRRVGYAIGRGERIPGGAGIAMPVFGPNNSVEAALALSMPSHRFNPKHLSQYVNWVRTTAKEISARLGRSKGRSA
jgi:IclR family KDG regulon transcriptional repressor